MSNSALATFINRTGGNYLVRSEGALISKIMIHNAMASGDRYDMAELVASGSSGYHYGISTDGVVGLFTDEDRAAYGCSNSDINDICIHILVLPSEDASGQISDTKRISSSTISKSSIDYNSRNKSATADGGGYAVNTSKTTLKKTNSKLSDRNKVLLIKLIEDICRRNFIRTCTFSPNNRSASTILCHSWYGGSADCPGKLESYFSEIATSVNNKLQTARLATESESLKARNTLAVGATSPFMVCPDPGVTGIDYTALREIGVIGTLIWGGGLFDSKRDRRKSYANPSINLQVEEAKKHNMPWAFYADVRSRTDAEARLECRELYYVISKYSPKLGLWLHLDFTGVSAFSAKQIIAIYYDKIVEWGLKGRCGFYTTKSQADLIDWPYWTDKFALWWIAPLGSVESLDSILTPSLFQLK